MTKPHITRLFTSLLAITLLTTACSSGGNATDASATPASAPVTAAESTATGLAHTPATASPLGDTIASPSAAGAAPAKEPLRLRRISAHNGSWQFQTVSRSGGVRASQLAQDLELGDRWQLFAWNTASQQWVAHSPTANPDATLPTGTTVTYRGTKTAPTALATAGLGHPQTITLAQGWNIFTPDPAADGLASGDFTRTPDGDSAVIFDSRLTDCGRQAGILIIYTFDQDDFRSRSGFRIALPCHPELRRQTGIPAITTIDQNDILYVWFNSTTPIELAFRDGRYTPEFTPTPTTITTTTTTTTTTTAPPAASPYVPPATTTTTIPQYNQAITADPARVPAEAGTVEVTINGTGWTGAPQGLFVTVCQGAENGDPSTITAANATAVCPTLLFDGGRGNPDANGNWSYTLMVNVTQQDIDNGSIAIIAGELAAGTLWTADTTIIVDATPPPATTTTTTIPQYNQAITADPARVPAEAGTVEVTINGTDWTGAPQGLFVTVCQGAENGDPSTITAANATAVCPTLLFDGGRGNPDANGNWSYTLMVNVTQQDIDNGSIAIIAGELAAGTLWTADTTIIVDATPPPPTTAPTLPPPTDQV